MSADIPKQIRRRREAADRLPPLEDGARDPLDRRIGRSPYPSTLRREYKAASVTLDESRGVVLVRGRAVADVMRRYGMVPLFCAAGRGWCVDAHHVSDLLAILECEQYRVSYREAA
jgi:hypothetical protein